MQFDWRNNLQNEDKERRTHTSKDFADPSNPNQRILIQSSGLLHAFTDKGFEDIDVELPNFKFPEGKKLTAKSNRHYIMDLPSWGDCRLEENGKILRVYDKKGMPIFKYTNPGVCPTGKKPFVITDKDRNKKDASNLKEISPRDQSIEKSKFVKDAHFEIENGKMYFKLAKANSQDIEAFDDTDTTATNNKDNYMVQTAPTSNRGSNTLFDLETGNKRRGIIQMTLPSGSGAISAIKFYLYCVAGDGTGLDINVYELTNHTNWGEATSNWNTYDGSNAWTGGGAEGDYGSVVDSATISSTGAWYNWVLVGTGSTNPMTLTWSSVVNLLIRFANEALGNYLDFPTKEYTDDTAKRPYIEITYSSTTTYTKTITAKARIKTADIAKTVTSKARILVAGVAKTIQAKSRIKILGVVKSIQAKAAIYSSNQKTVTSKARIFSPNITNTVTAKGRIKIPNNVDFITAKARIKVAGTVKTVTAKAKIKASRKGFILMKNKDQSYKKSMFDNII